MLSLDLSDDTPGVPVRRCSCGALLCTPARCPACDWKTRVIPYHLPPLLDLVRHLERGPLSGNALARRTGTDRKTVSGRLARLRGLGVVAYTPAPENVWRLL